MTTVRDLIKRAMRKNMSLTNKQEPTAEEAQDARVEMNAMTDLWANDNLMVYARTLEGFTLTGGVAEYTIGTGGAFNTGRPTFIASAYIRQGTTDYPVAILSDEAFANIQTKSTGGIPRALNFDNAYPLAKIKLHPAPTEAYTLFLLNEKPLSAVTSLSTEISLPPGWESVIVDNLAVRLAPEYGKDPSPLLLKAAADGVHNLRLASARIQTMDFDVPNNTGDIYTGWQ
jgi:hypothetical protein